MKTVGGLAKWWPAAMTFLLFWWMWGLVDRAGLERYPDPWHRVSLYSGVGALWLLAASRHFAARYPWITSVLDVTLILVVAAGVAVPFLWFCL